MIIDVDDYAREAYRQLDNTEFHKKLPNDTTELNRTKINKSIEELKTLGLLDEKTANKHQNSRCFRKFTKKETLADQ